MARHLDGTHSTLAKRHYAIQTLSQSQDHHDRERCRTPGSEEYPRRKLGTPDYVGIPGTRRRATSG